MVKRLLFAVVAGTDGAGIVGFGCGGGGAPPEGRLTRFELDLLTQTKG